MNLFAASFFFLLQKKPYFPRKKKKNDWGKCLDQFASYWLRPYKLLQAAPTNLIVCSNVHKNSKVCEVITIACDFRFGSFDNWTSFAWPRTVEIWSAMI